MLNFRGLWYSVLTSLLAFLIGNIVALPWYFLILPLVIVLVTVFYFDRTDQVKLLLSKKIRKNNDIIFALGLSVSVLWFLMLVLVSILSIAGFYYFDFLFYLSDPRIWLLYPLVLLVPVVYSLLLQNNLSRKHHKRVRKALNLPSHL